MIFEAPRGFLITGRLKQRDRITSRVRLKYETATDLKSETLISGF